MHPVAHAEIEPHARAVLRHHWPDTPLHGDVTQVNWAQYAGQVDLVAGGSPCQDLSVAGKRAGLAGARSGLFYELIRAWHETGATYCLWENVDGARSSNNGEDFAAVLSAFVGATITVPSDGWRGSGVAAGRTAVAAWRVLDLRFFGAPQRRVRIFVLVARAGGCDPAKILFGEQQPVDDSCRNARLDDIRDAGRISVVPYTRGNTTCAVQLAGRERYILPVEAERAMSWPDGWTANGINKVGKLYALSDRARYRLCGNGVGAPVAAWIGRQIMAAARA